MPAPPTATQGSAKASLAPLPAPVTPVPAIGHGLADRRARRVLPVLLTALACAAFGLAALGLAIPPGYAAPLNPAPGIALASVLVFGRRMLVGVGIGAFTVAAALCLGLNAHDVPSLLMAPVVAVAAVLQAGFGALLVRRFVRWPLTLTVPADVIRFLAACTASSIVAPSLAAGTLGIGGLISSGQLLQTWATWWIGDLAGLLVVTPIALTLIGRPRSEWAPRRLSVGLTLTLAATLLAIGIVQVGRWKDERLRERFLHDASNASLILVTQLQEPLRALEALRDVYSVSRELSSSQLHDATENWLGGGAVRSMGWAEHVRRADLGAFEARARNAGATGFHVFAWPGSSPDAAASKTLIALGVAADNDVIAIRHVEPPALASGALGLDALTLPATRVALLDALESGRPTLATDMRAPGPHESGDVVLFQAVYDGDIAGRNDRRNALRGMVFVTVALEQQLRGLAGKVAPHLN
ncbi:MAG: CHASE domain-containing protein, partial [Pseudomonadota bacterium]|nr:CHASE domain-containing protein [Pseudomonadota bacterium]